MVRLPGTTLTLSMPLTPLLSDPTARDALLARVASLSPEAPRQWGKMTVHHMVWHLTECNNFALGKLDLPDRSNWFSRSIMRWIALHTKMPWPKGGVPTADKVNAERNPPPATPLEISTKQLSESITSLAAAQVGGRSHPAFGVMTQDEWQHWAWRHADHHLKQFGA